MKQNLNVFFFVFMNTPFCAIHFFFIELIRRKSHLSTALLYVVYAHSLVFCIKILKCHFM